MTALHNHDPARKQRDRDFFMEEQTRPVGRAGKAHYGSVVHFGSRAVKGRAAQGHPRLRRPLTALAWWPKPTFGRPR